VNRPAITRGFPPNQPGALARRFLERLETLPDSERAAVDRLIDEQIEHLSPEYADALHALDLVEKEHVLDRGRIRPDVSEEDPVAELQAAGATSSAIWADWQRTAIKNAAQGLYYSDILAPHHVDALYAAFAEAIPLESL
jgi:hypothetical protein